MDTEKRGVTQFAGLSELPEYPNLIDWFLS